MSGPDSSPSMRGGPDFANQDNERAYRQRYLEGGSGLLPEILRREYNPDLVTFAVRKIIAGQEALIAQGQEPDQWSFRIARDTLDGRKSALSLEQYPNLSPELQTKLETLGLRFDKGREILKTLEAVDLGKSELFARWTVLEALHKQLQMGTDVENYALKYFFATWATWPEARHYEIIGRLGPSPIIPERDPDKEAIGFGTLVDRALRYWDDISLGKAAKDGVGNIFGDETYQDQIDKAMAWIIGKLVKDSGYRLPNDSAAREASLGYQDLAEAANLALILFRQTDMDVGSCYRQEKTVEKGSIFDILLALPEDLDIYKLEIGPLSKDTGKLAWWVLRSLAEAGREYPASIGLPLLAGKFPNLTTDFWHMMKIKRTTADERGEKETQIVSLYDLWKNWEVELGDLPWDIKEWQKGAALFDQKLGNKDSRNNEREWTIPKGIAKLSFNVPYFLEIFAAYRSIYSVIVEPDVTKTYTTLTTPFSLRKLNKQWTLVFNLMCDGILDKGVTRRISQLSKCVLLGSAFVANASYGTGKGVDFEKPRTDYDTYLAPDGGVIRGRFKGASVEQQIRVGRQAAFLTRSRKEQLEDDELTKAELAELEELTIRYIIENRVALTPGEASKVIRTKKGKTWFSDKELEKIGASGLYRPFGENAVEKRRPKLK